VPPLNAQNNALGWKVTVEPHYYECVWSTIDSGDFPGTVRDYQYYDEGKNISFTFWA